MKHFSVPAKIKTLVVKKQKSPSVLNKPKPLRWQTALWGVQVETERAMVDNTILPLQQKKKKSVSSFLGPRKRCDPQLPRRWFPSSQERFHLLRPRSRLSSNAHPMQACASLAGGLCSLLKRYSRAKSSESFILRGFPKDSYPHPHRYSKFFLPIISPA